MDQNTYADTQERHLHIPSDVHPLLLNIAQWAKFVAVVGFIILALGVLGLLSMGTFMGGMSHYATSARDYSYTPGVFSWGYALGMIVLLGVYFVPVYLLFKFATNLKKAVIDRNNSYLIKSFSFLNKHYIYIGILAIMVITFYVIAAIVMAIGMYSYW
ncbi:MAG: hypothetical protein E6772_07370 [Dysgonomonas sp.]|nr:hypothetical protein [Dysgonomonas sp.]